MAGPLTSSLNITAIKEKKRKKKEKNVASLSLLAITRECHGFLCCVPGLHGFLDATHQVLLCLLVLMGKPKQNKIYIETQTTCEKKFNKKCLFFDSEDFIFNKISKILSCKIKGFKQNKKCDRLTYRQSDSQRSSAPKNLADILK